MSTKSKNCSNLSLVPLNSISSFNLNFSLCTSTIKHSKSAFFQALDFAGSFKSSMNEITSLISVLNLGPCSKESLYLFKYNSNSSSLLKYVDSIVIIKVTQNTMSLILLISLTVKILCSSKKGFIETCSAKFLKAPSNLALCISIAFSEYLVEFILLNISLISSIDFCPKSLTTTSYSKNPIFSASGRSM